MDRNNNSNKNIKLQIKSFLKKISLQLYFKRVNVPKCSLNALLPPFLYECS